MTIPSDAARVRAVLAGDRDAFGDLVRRHQERLYRRALAMLGDPDLAADMVQDACIRAYGRLADADPDRFAAWLHRILRNLCLDEVRSPRARTAELPDHLAGGAGPDRELESRELGAALEASLGALGPTLREAFVLKHVEGLSYDEMSELTGAAVSALKMRVKRAREGLQELLDPADHGVAM